jgi:transcriptional regulator with XRE-family HTH domain
MRIGERVRLRRQELGLSQAALAQRVGVRQATISELESSKQRETSTGLARRLARALRCDVGWLVGTEVETDEPAAAAREG